MPKTFNRPCVFVKNVKCNYEYPCNGCQYFSADARVITPSASHNKCMDAIALAKWYIKAYPASLTLKQVMSGFVEWVEQQHHA